MSRRYGRNQKRRARQEIERLRCAHALADGLSKRLLAENARLQDQLANVVDALGPNFVGLPPEVAAYQATQYDWDRGNYRALASGDDVVSMQMLCIEDGRDRVSNRIHFRVRLADGNIGYALSEQALWDTPAAVLGRQLAVEIAPALVRACQKHRGGKR